MNNKISMRDSFLNKIYDLAEKDKDVIIISGDMGAPALDKYKRDFENRFFNVGIAEQNMIAIAAGLAKEGKKVFAYAIAPFITSRCHEFTKINASLMKIPIHLIGVGSGFSYDDSGPTHHTTEDISIMRPLPNLEILSPSDSNMAGACAGIAYGSKNATYIRLDREILPDLSEKYYFDDSFKKGFKELESGADTAIISTGNMVHRALEVSKLFEEKKEKIGVIDLYKLSPVNKEIVPEIFKKYRQIVSLEEHLLAGGLGSIVSEIILDNNLNTKLKRIGLKDYHYLYGRANIHKNVGLDVYSIVNEIENLKKG